MTYVTFNINQNVRVRLTARGREIHRRNFEKFVHDYPRFPYPYTKPDEDADGWSTWQLWQLMREFGPHMMMGLDPPFDTTI